MTFRGRRRLLDNSRWGRKRPQTPREQSSRNPLERTAIRAALTAAVVLAAPAALAQPAPADQAAADALYDQGRALQKAGKQAEGCAKFEASMALAPAATTVINIARCHVQDGKLATAWSDYQRVMALGKDIADAERRRGLEDLAHQEMAALEPRVPKLRVAVAKAPPGVRVQADDKDLALGEASPFNPGPHHVRVSAPGYREETRSVTLEEGKTAVVELELRRTGDAPTPTPSTGASGGWSKPAGIALTALGAVGLGVGAITGGLSLSKVSDIKSRCTGNQCLAADQGEADSARTLGNVATATLVAGGVIAAAGVVLLVVRPGDAAAHVSVGLGPRRIDLRVTF